MGHWFFSWWGNWIFWGLNSFRPHFGHGVYSVAKKWLPEVTIMNLEQIKQNLLT